MGQDCTLLSAIFGLCVTAVTLDSFTKRIEEILNKH